MTAINIACWNVCHGKIRDNDDESVVHDAMIIMPVSHEDSLECVLCAHGACDIRIELPKLPGELALVSHGGGGAS